MITKSNLKELYKWASSTEFPLKKAPTTVGYSNKDIYICGLKYIRKNVNIRKSKMTNTIYNIMKNDEILYAVYSREEQFLNHIKTQMFIVIGIREFRYH